MITTFIRIRTNHILLNKNRLKLLLDNVQIAVDELDRNVPLQEIVDDDPSHHHDKVDTAGQMPDRAVYNHVNVIVFDSVRL